MATKAPAKRKKAEPADPWRPTKLTDAVAEVIVQTVRDRNHLETAAAVVGLNIATVRMWAREGARVIERCERHPEDKAKLTAQEKRLASFSAALVRASGYGEAESVDTIGRAATEPAVMRRETTKCVGTDKDGEPIMVTETVIEQRPPDWRAEAFRLERRYPARWGQVSRNEHSGPGGGPIPVELQVEGLMAKWAAARAEGEPAELEPGVIDVEAVEE